MESDVLIESRLGIESKIALLKLAFIWNFLLYPLSISPSISTFCTALKLYNYVPSLIIIIITEHLILRTKIQEKSKAFLLPIIFSTELDEFSAFS